MSQATDARLAGAATDPARRTAGLTRPGQSRPGQSRPGQSRPGQMGQGHTRPGLIGPDESRWLDVFAVPRSGIRAAIAWVVFSRAVARLPVLVRLPGGRRLGGGSAGAPEMVLHRPGDFCARVGAGGLIGFGESYMAGDWDCYDLTGLITVFARQVASLVPRPLQRLRRVSVRRQPAAERSTRARARRNISHHYDLSNELFALFLDETMTYSSALFETSTAETSTAETSTAQASTAETSTAATTTAEQDAAGALVAGADRLAAAQQRKIDRLLDLTGVGPGTRVLEVGTGWGELAIRAAARGATVRTVTLSEQQRALAIRRIAEAGLDGRVSVELRDYRDIPGQYDAILSVEMVEAVGERYWPAYFETLDRLLAPGGRIGLQAITMAHDRMLATRNTYTWILKYIFPGGLIPSVTAIEETLARHTRLRVAGRLDFGPHYEQTLRIWRERFTARRADLPGLGFDEVFARMWELYLSYSEAGFAASYLDVCQFLLERAR